MFDKHTELKAVGLMAVLLFAAAAVGLSALDGADNVAEVESVTADSDGVEWVNHVTVEKNGEVIHEGTNTLMNQGADFVAMQITETGTDTWGLDGSAEGAAAEVIALGEDEDVDTFDGTETSLTNEITTNDLDRAAADFTQENIGEFHIEYTFTAGGGETVRSTALHWACTDGDNSNCATSDVNASTGHTESMISAANFDTAATLESGDDLTVTHQITISDGS